MVTGFLNELSMSNKLNSWLDVFGIFFFFAFLGVYLLVLVPSAAAHRPLFTYCSLLPPLFVLFHFIV